jgi:PAS domain S-box-containing protein
MVGGVKVADHDAAQLLNAEHAVGRVLERACDERDAYPELLSAIGDALGWAAGAVWLGAEQAARRGGGGREPAVAARVQQTGEPEGNCFPIRGTAGVLGAIELSGCDACDAVLSQTLASLGARIGHSVERWRGEQQLRESDARKSAILNAAFDAIIVMDAEGDVVEVNAATERMFGYTAEEMVGRELAELIVPARMREAHRRGVREFAETGTGKMLGHPMELPAMRKDGSEFPVEIAISQPALPGPPQFTGFLRDVTRRKQDERALRASRARIVEAADAERRRIERNLHDGAQQRLVALSLILRLAERKLAAAGGDEHELVHQAAAELGDALTELRELARGIHPAVLTDRGLRPALEMLAGRAAVPVELEFEVAERLPDAVEAAAYYLVSEAITNTAKYARASLVRVRVSRRDSVVTVRVADDGVGGADAAGGSGLRGLADRVEALGGTLVVKSPRGEGTTLTARLPCE